MATIEAIHSDIAMMIDNETLALGPDAFVTQVGMCVANLKTREYIIGPNGYWLSTVGQDDRVIDPGTVRWWLQQDPAVIRSVLAPPDGMKRVTREEMFRELKTIVDLYPGMTVWGSPAMFDLPMLTHLWEGRKPWKYSAERDMMTLYKELDPEGALHPPQADGSMGHNAVYDAKWQMEYLFNLKEHLRNMHDIRGGLKLAAERNQVLTLDPTAFARP